MATQSFPGRYQSDYGQSVEVHARRLRGAGGVDLSLGGSATTYAVAPGDVLALQLDAYNASAWPEWSREGAATATGIQVTAALSSDVGLLDASGDGWVCEGNSSCTYDRLVAPQTAMAPLHVTVRAPDQPGSYQMDFSILAHQVEDSPADNQLSVVLNVLDSEPDPFAFREIANAPRSTWLVSNPVVVSGINVPVQVSVSGGEYSVDGGLFTASPGQLEAGRVVRVRHLSSAAFSTRTESELMIGPVSAAFASITEAEDATPDAFEFADVVGAQRKSTITSDPVVPMGFNVPVTISVDGGSWSRNGGPFQQSPGSVQPGDAIRLQVQTSPKRYETSRLEVSIGGSSDTWSVTTGR